IAGISTAIALKTQLKYTNFTIYERAASVGGTWRDNTYPGCGSDVPGHAYSLSSELNPEWSSYLVSQPEIRAYWEKLFCKHELDNYTLFNHEIRSLDWDADAQLWRLTVVDREAGAEKRVEAHLVVSAIGGFMYPLYPDIQGRESFKGLTWHSARWRHDVDLTGKRVGVVGNGCSAAQLIPRISANPDVNVVNFCRTRQWYSPRVQYTYPAWSKLLFRNVPLLLWLYRNYLMVKAEFGYIIFNKRHRLPIKVVTKVFSNYIKRTAPAKYHDILIPPFPPGCKRIIIDPGFLESLHRPNVSMVWDPIEKIEETGITLGTGDFIPLDVIVYATGYGLNPEAPMRGSMKLGIQEYFASQGGPTAYMGTCVPGLPNLFTLLGPNVATGHSSVIFSEEVQIQYVLQLMKPVIDGEVKSFEVQSAASDAYNAWLQKRMEDSVWTECNSYYRSDRKHGKVVANFPGTMSLFWWTLRKPRWEDFKVVGGKAWTERRRRSDRLRLLGIVTSLVALIWFGSVNHKGIRKGLQFWIQKVSSFSSMACTCVETLNRGRGGMEMKDREYMLCSLTI
ncbi:FAD/NAD(P)-binding domain-containing protein, partial [Heliocybe sulcata]